MVGDTLTTADRDLIETATTAIRERYKPGVERTSRSVGAALRTTAGEVYTGVSLNAATPRASVCAEPVAVGAAITAGDLNFDTIVSVKYGSEDVPGASEPTTDDSGEAVVISPCGVCRELIRDYDSATDAIVRDDGKVGRVVITDLLPSMEWRDGGPPEP